MVSIFGHFKYFVDNALQMQQKTLANALKKLFKTHLRRNSTSSLALLSEAARCQPTTPSHTQPEGAPQHEAIAVGRQIQ